MGNVNKTKKEPSEVENLLTHTYKNTDLEFSYKEVLTFKLRINDAENYFYTKFDFFFYFNNYLFRERLSILYDNFNLRIENFSAQKPKDNFAVLVDFDDESDNISRGSKIDFDSLFTIVFEKLEISVILFFDMTNVDKVYILDFFSQLVESVDLYKYNRKFDCLYYLLPNTDYVVKNDCAFIYLTQKIIPNKKIFFNEQTCNIHNEYMNAIFSKLNNDKLLNSRYPKIEGNNYLEYFLEKCKPTQIKAFMNLNLISEIESFVIINEDQIKTLELLVQSCPLNIIVFYDFFFTNNKILEFFLKKVANLLDKSNVTENVLILKLFINSNKLRDLNFFKIRKFLESVITDFEIYNFSNHKRKFILEFFEYTPLVHVLLSSRESRGEEESILTKNEINYRYSKIVSYWFLGNRPSSNVKLFFNLMLIIYPIVKNVKNRIILNSVKEYLFSNFICKVSHEYKVTNEDDLINQ
jgi:hypothetical protein